MQHSPERPLNRFTFAAPGLFILLWSSGFIGGKYGLPYAEPFTFLTIRMVIVVALLAVMVAISRPARPSPGLIGHNIVSGLLVHGCYLGGRTSDNFRRREVCRDRPEHDANYGGSSRRNHQGNCVLNKSPRA